MAAQCNVLAGGLETGGGKLDTAAMRIIAGEHRGRKLIPPGDHAVTRPITDRVKQPLFDRLTAHGFFEVEQGDPPIHVVDLFAGTGSLGIEALSRGAEFCTFLEQDHDAADRLEQNLVEIGLQERARVVRGDALGAAWQLRLDETPLTMVFLDPPYPMVEAEGGLERMKQAMVELRPRLATIAVVTLRTPAKLDPPAIEGYRGPGIHAYGNTQLNFYITDTTPMPEAE